MDTYPYLIGVFAILLWRNLVDCGLPIVVHTGEVQGSIPCAPTRNTIKSITYSIKLINGSSRETARIYLDEAHDTRTPPETIQKILEDPRMIYAAAPRNLMKFVDFMHTVGQLKSQPENWKDLFFPEGQSEDGS
jgi:hypothetical protein